MGTAPTRARHRSPLATTPGICPVADQNRYAADRSTPHRVFLLDSTETPTPCCLLSGKQSNRPRTGQERPNRPENRPQAARTGASRQVGGTWVPGIQKRKRAGARWGSPQKNAGGWWCPERHPSAAVGVVERSPSPVWRENHGLASGCPGQPQGKTDGGERTRAGEREPATGGLPWLGVGGIRY